MSSFLLLGAGTDASAGGGGGTVTRDAVGAYARSGSVTSYSYTGLTTGGSANGVLAFVTMENRTAAHISSVTIDGSAMTQIGTVALITADTTTAVYAAIVTPSASPRTIAITTDVADNIDVAAISFNGVNSTLATAFTVPSGWTPNNPIPGDGLSHASISITSTLGSGHMAAFAGRVGQSSASSLTLSPASLTSENILGFDGAITTSSTSGAMTVTPNVSDVCCAIAVDISP